MGTGIVRVSFSMLSRLLHLPEDTQLLAISTGLHGRYLELLLEGDALPPEPEELEPYALLEAYVIQEVHPGDPRYVYRDVVLRPYEENSNKTPGHNRSDRLHHKGTETS